MLLRVTTVRRISAGALLVPQQNEQTRRSCPVASSVTLTRMRGADQHRLQHNGDGTAWQLDDPNAWHCSQDAAIGNTGTLVDTCVASSNGTVADLAFNLPLVRFCKLFFDALHKRLNTFASWRKL